MEWYILFLMPLHGFIKTFPLKILTSISFLLIAVTLFGLAYPKYAMAEFVLRGGTCYFRYGNTSGQTQELPVDINLCTGGQGNGACMANLSGECRQANVPGGGGSGCTTSEIVVEYLPVGQTPQFLRFTAGCSATWSNGINSSDYGLNIAYFRRSDRSWTDLTSSTSALGAAQNNSKFKIANGDASVTIPMSWFAGEIADTTTGKTFGFYPNCAGDMTDGIEADCYRIEDLDPYVPPPPPPCVMPTEQVSYTTSCTPGSYSNGTQKTGDVVHALNLNLGGNYCQIDTVNISSIQNPPFPNYYNSPVNGVSEKPIPQGFTYRGDGSNLILAPNANYWISYYDTQSGQLSPGRQFTTRGPCATPNATSISQVPQCRFTFPYDTEPQYDRIYLKWGTPTSQGLGFQGYDIQVDSDPNFGSPINFATATGINEIPFGAPAYSSNIPLGYTYYYRVRGVNWGGPGAWSPVRSGFIWMKPAGININATAVPISGSATNATANINWDYTTNPIYAVQTTGSGFVLKRNGGPGVTAGWGFGSTVRNYTDTFLPQCTNTDYTYSINGVNVCGNGPTTSDTTTCPANRAPTCSPVEYYNGSAWVDYPSGGLLRNSGATVQVRRVCTDPESNTMTTTWNTSGCGTVSPLTGATTTYTFPGAKGTSCDITASTKDSLNAATLPNETVIANTNPTAGVSSITLAPDTRSIQRSSTADAYAVVGGVTQNIATMKYTVTGYNNPAYFGAPVGVNNTGMARIDTTATTISTNITNICNPTYGTCSFALSGTGIYPIGGSNTTLIINVSFTAAQLANVKDVMVGPTATSPVRFGMSVNFSATGEDGVVIDLDRTASPTIINNPPYCDGVTINPGSPLNTGTTNITVEARDDWGVNQINVGVSPAAGNLLSPDVNTAAGSPRYATTTVPWNVTNVAHGNYQLTTTITDLDGRSASCNAASSVVGSQNPGGGTGTPPVIMVDKVAPTCTAGSFIVTPNADGSVLGFAVSGNDPGTVAGGLKSLDITVLKPGQTTWTSTGSGVTFNPPVASYAFTDTTGYTLTNGPSGLYNFRANWTDDAGNTSNCAASYEKGSRISGRVILYTGTNGDQKRDYANESTGTRFNAVSRLGTATPVSANWNLATNTTCSAPYPGTAAAGTDTGACNAWFITNAEYSSTSQPKVGIRFPALTSNATIPKYRCTTMRLYNTVVSTTTPTDTYTGASIVPVACAAGVCGCDVTLQPGDITVNSAAAYTATSIWPTHVEFDIDYNSDQVYGTVRNENGTAIQNVTVTAGGLTPADITDASGNYETPSPVGDNSAGYPRSGVTSGSAISTPVVLSNADQTKLCISAVKKDFTNNASRNTSGNFDSAAEVGAIARTLAMPASAGTGWSVNADDACTATVPISNGVMSPKYQTQANYLLIPKVKVTGNIYFLNKDNLCGDQASWSNPANQVTGTTVPLTLTMQTNSGSTDFYSPDGDTSYSTGQSYTYYANTLPGSTWSSWQFQKNISFAAGSSYTTCPNNTINVSTSVSNYPASTTINSDIAVYVREANDWWQTYNGGVHGLVEIQDAIPNENLAVEVSGFNMHTIVGVPNNVVYTNTSPATIKTGFRPSSSGALVTTRGDLSTINAGRSGANWQISSDRLWAENQMPALKIPFASGTSADTVEAIDKVRALTTGSWSTSLPNFSTSGSNNKVLLTGNQTIGSTSTDTSFGNNNYILVDGALTINGNLKPSGTNLDQTIFIIAKGNVTIAPGVTEINAFIYTPGDIDIQTAGQDSTNEKVLKVYGGLYSGGTIHQRRDIENTTANFGYPSVQIMFNPALIISTRSASFPSQLKETNVYWTQQ